MDSKRIALSLIPGERRNSRRSVLIDDRTATLYIKDNDPAPVLVHLVDLGSFGVLSKTPLKSLNGIIDLEVKHLDELLINGKWKHISTRAQTDGQLYIFEHPLAQFIKKNLSSIAPDTFLKSSRYRIMDISSADDLSEVSKHLTEIKEFIVRVKVLITTKLGSYEGSFDFSSERKVIDVLEFQVFDCAGKFSTNEQVRIEYTHLGVRYVLNSVIENCDEGFGLITAKFPSYLLAITARRFDRHECDLAVKISSDVGSVQGRLLQLSPSGGLLQCDDIFKNQDNLKLCFSIIEENLGAYVVHCSQSHIGIRFENDEITRKGLHKIFMLSLPKNVVARNSTNYKQFAELYGQVGYRPADETDIEKWHTDTFKSWSYQDELLPGNCTGGVDGAGRLISSAGTLPISDQIAYGHSFCMLKTPEAVAAFFEQTLHSLAVAELLPGIRYYAGSYSKKSRFTSKLHVIFESHAKPHRQALVHGLSVLPEKRPSAISHSTLNCEIVTDLSTLKITNQAMREIQKILSSPHTVFHEVHTIETFKVTFSGSLNPCAVIIKSSAWKTFTAAGMFNIAWVFIVDEAVNVANVVSAIEKASEFNGMPLEVIDFDGTCKRLNDVVIENASPVFWSFTDKDDFGPIIASVCRSIYSVMKKYGEQGISEYLRVS